MTKIAHHKGKAFLGPEGQVYVIARDVFVGEAVDPDDVIAVNGAPEFKYGDEIPEWFLDQAGIYR